MSFVRRRRTGPRLLPDPVLNPEKGIALFTDGSCWTGDRIGGWAYVAIDAFDNKVDNSGGEEDTTISQMELMAVAIGLEEIFQFLGPCDILVFSDSEYVVKGATDKTRQRKVNLDLWGWLDHWESRHKLVVYEHIRGHRDSHYNNEADRLAGLARVREQNS